MRKLPGQESLEAGHEILDIWGRGLMYAAFSIIAFAVLMHALLSWGFFMMEKHVGATTPNSATVGERQPPPPPRLELSESETRDALRPINEQKLGSYGWVDRQAGIARIPIDRAIDIMSHGR